MLAELLISMHKLLSFECFSLEKLSIKHFSMADTHTRGILLVLYDYNLFHSRSKFFDFKYGSNMIIEEHHSHLCMYNS